MLPEAPTYQAVAADLDGDDAPEVLRLVRGERGSILAEAWSEADGTWSQAGNALQAVPGRPTGTQGNVTHAGTPARLIVRRVGDRDRVTLVRQPRFDEPDLEIECCLLLDDLVMDDGELRLQAVADPGNAVGAVSVLDLDGDGTDELLATRSLPPLGDISFPAEARVYRWNGTSFGPPTVTELPVGSGDTPFVLGDSDGIPGEEAAIIPTVGAGSLHRVSLGAGDTLEVEDSEVFATDAVAVSLGDGRGVAIFAAPDDVSVYPWPPDDLPREAIGQALIPDAALLGPVRLREEERLLVSQPARHTLHLPSLPGLDAPGFTITRSPAAAAFASAHVTPFVGPLPGGGPDGEPAIIYAGALLPFDGSPTDGFLVGISPFATLAGAQPVGLVGRDRAWMAILHAPLGILSIDPAGGRLDAPLLQPGSGVSLAPVELVRARERDDGSFEPLVPDAPAIDARGTLAVGPRGFSARVEAPPGSRIYVGEADPSVLGVVRIVPESGRLDVAMVPPVEAAPNTRARLSLAVTTPAGHGYLATWEIRVLTDAPGLEARASTAFASASVVVEGRTAPFVALTVGGRAVSVETDGAFRADVNLPPWPTDVDVVATDPLGNQARVTVSGVGLFDYRTLPWIPITVALVAAAAIVLVLRVPRSKPTPRGADDAVLEELEPD
jgi:hypothetical protein